MRECHDRRFSTLRADVAVHTVDRAVAGTIAGADLPLSTPVRGPDHRLSDLDAPCGGALA